MVVIGDSIAMGCWIRTKEKYYYKGSWLLQNKLMRPIEVTVLAIQERLLSSPKRCGIRTLIYQSRSQQLGSNYIGAGRQYHQPRKSWSHFAIRRYEWIRQNVNTILNPLTDPAQIRSFFARYWRTITEPIVKLLGKCTNSKIHITTYYPIVSNNNIWIGANVFANEFCEFRSDQTKVRVLIY